IDSVETVAGSLRFNAAPFALDFWPDRNEIDLPTLFAGVDETALLRRPLRVSKIKTKRTSTAAAAAPNTEKRSTPANNADKRSIPPPRHLKYQVRRTVPLANRELSTDPANSPRGGACRSRSAGTHCVANCVA